MSKTQVFNANVLRGLQTTTEDEATEFPSLVVSQDCRVSEGVIRRRAGSAIVSRGTLSGDNLDFDAASSEHVSIPTNAVHALGKEWTFECLISPDGVVGSQYVIGFAHATDWPIQIRMNGANVEVVVTDSAGATTTLTGTTTHVGGDVIGVQVERLGTSLTLSVNGVDEDTDSMADLVCKVPTAAMYIGRDNTGNYFDGKIDYVRCFDFARGRHDDYLTRWLDPRADSVLFDYFIQQDANALVHDRSKYENHGIAVNTPADAGSTLSHPHAPGLGIKQYRNTDDQRRTLIAIGTSLYDAAL